MLLTWDGVSCQRQPPASRPAFSSSGPSPSGVLPEYWVNQSNGGLELRCSSAAEAGWFWSHDRRPEGTVLLVGTDPATVLAARHRRTTLDHEYLRGYLYGIPPERTPYREVHRIPPTVTATFPGPGSQPRVQHSPAPREPETSAADYLRAIDGVLDQWAAAAPLAVLVSGGLDSSFLLGSLLHNHPDLQVLAVTAAPLADAPLGTRGVWEPDELALVQELVDCYPGQVEFVVLRNEGVVLPLDAAAAAYQRSWLPSFVVSNEWWVQGACREAEARGIRWMLQGGAGNAVFSLAHRMAGYELLGRGHPVRAARLVLHPPQGMTRPAATRYLVAGPLADNWRRSRPHQNPWLQLGVTAPPAGRIDFALTSSAFRDAFASGRTGGHSAALHPAAQPGCQLVDPFRAEAVLDTARRLAPEAWLAGPGGTRGLARTLATGRVPDSIRLRTNRGHQSADTWYVMHNQRQRYLDEVDAVSATPGMCDWVHVPALRAYIAKAAWGDPRGPGPVVPGMLNRLLALAGFIRLTASRLAALPASSPPTATAAAALDGVRTARPGA